MNNRLKRDGGMEGYDIKERVKERQRSGGTEETRGLRTGLSQGLGTGKKG
jgi:hypothetical protein